MRRPTLIDCDPGIDDAIALLLAVRSPELDVVGVTAVSGNLLARATADNARRVVAFADRDDVPVGRGPDAALVRPLAPDPFSHGPGGLGGVALPLPEVRTRYAYAPDMICAAADHHAGELTVVTLGPLTNLALALLRDPDLPAKVARVVMLGGSYGLGPHAWRNGTGGNPVSEWNVYVDPEAARAVLHAGFDLTAVGLDAATHPEIDLTADQIGQLRAGGRLGQFAAQMVDFVLGRGFRSYCALIDALAVAAAIEPDLVETERVRCTVETVANTTRGMTVVDSRHHFAWDAELSTILVARRADYLRFHDLLLSRLQD